ncbi:hypothetical protein NEOLEDRAFT_941347 [Neolentinus lepideus HHB14362 ss-1]|uniref:Uncharacterized protein n=1 Tax=Neolentinus lepideus HHB14362 ss-1 TaxID=1314782 RepID=A0A165NF57_9AGAM|nr:hypothetical protein NEOLEDRAFT_941347 [Neolentinus lepideus HHB14362 ss-1]
MCCRGRLRHTTHNVESSKAYQSNRLFPAHMLKSFSRADGQDLGYSKRHLVRAVASSVLQESAQIRYRHDDLLQNCSIDSFHLGAQGCG